MSNRSLTKELQYVECRTLGHAWDEYHDGESDAELILLCTRCTTTRYDWINKASGELEGRRYIYPEGYARKRKDRPNIQELRLELMLRLRKSK